MHIWQMWLRLVQVCGLLGLVLVANPITFTYANEHLLATAYPPESYAFALLKAALIVGMSWAIFTICMLVGQKKGLGQLFQSHALYVAVTFVAGLLVMLAVNPISAGHLQWLRILLPMGNLLLLAKAFHLGFVRPSGNAWWLRFRPLATMVFTILGLFFVLEGIFMFVARSQANDNALASKVWFARYWETNRNGFRESTALEQDDTSKAQLEFIGDSFLAGHGVKDPARRFSDLIQAKVGNGWRVHNHGQNGADSETEGTQQIGQHWDDPKLIVLCWYVNDIEDVAKSHGLKTGNEGLQRPFPISLVHGSYLLDYFDGVFPNEQAGANYLDFLKKAYADRRVYGDYLFHLKFIASFARVAKARFAVVLFPMLNAVKESDFAIRPMRDYWAGQGVPCLDLTPIYAHYAPEELIVNSSDAHPNEFAHQLAADAIYTFLNAHQLLDD